MGFVYSAAMSDLQCPARVFVARHGEAEYESEHVLDHGGSLTVRGRAQARTLGERLSEERVARVFASTVSRAVQTAELAAAVLGVEVTVREGLAEFAVGEARGQEYGDGLFEPYFTDWLAGRPEARIPGGESGSEIAARVAAVLDAIADAHRGEAVLVVCHGGAILATLSVLAWRPGRTSAIQNCAVACLERDANGWRLTADLTL